MVVETYWIKGVKSTNLRKTWDGIPIAGCTTPTIKCGRSQRNFAIYTFIQLFNSLLDTLDAPCKAMNPWNDPERSTWSLSGVGWSYRVMVGGWLDFHPDNPNRLSHGEPMIVETASVPYFFLCTIGPGIEPATLLWTVGGLGIRPSGSSRRAHLASWEVITTQWKPSKA